MDFGGVAEAKGRDEGLEVVEDEEGTDLLLVFR